MVQLLKTSRVLYQFFNKVSTWQVMLDKYFPAPEYPPSLDYQQSPKLLFRLKFTEKKLDKTQDLLARAQARHYYGNERGGH